MGLIAINTLQSQKKEANGGRIKYTPTKSLMKSVKALRKVE